MRTRRATRFSPFEVLAAGALALSLAAGCGSESAPAEESLAPPPPARGVQLHAGPFRVEPGEEIRKVVVVNLPETLLVSALESFTTGSAHHFAVDATIAGFPDGAYDHEEIYTEEVMANSMSVFSTTLPRDRIEFGGGIAGKLPAGFLTALLSLHYLNTSSEPVMAEGWVNVETIPPEEVTTLINGAVAAMVDFEVPARSERTFTGRCATDKAMDILAVTHHAHAAMTNFELRFVRGGQRPEAPHHTSQDGLTSTLTRFVEQPIHLEPGDLLEWSCTFANTGETPIVEGDQVSKREEMCQAISLYMPDQGFRACTVSPENPERAFKQLTPPAQP